MSPRTNHIAIAYHFFRSNVKSLEIKVEDVGNKDQLSDQFNKGWSQNMFKKARFDLMGW